VRWNMSRGFEVRKEETAVALQELLLRGVVYALVVAQTRLGSQSLAGKRYSQQQGVKMSRQEIDRLRL
jgi:hypothetical protein